MYIVHVHMYIVHSTMYVSVCAYMHSQQRAYSYSTREKKGTRVGIVVHVYSVICVYTHYTMEEFLHNLCTTQYLYLVITPCILCTMYICTYLVLGMYLYIRTHTMYLCTCTIMYCVYIVHTCMYIIGRHVPLRYEVPRTHYT